MWGHPRDQNSSELVAVQSVHCAERVNDLCLYNAFKGIYAVPSGRLICSLLLPIHHGWVIQGLIWQAASKMIDGKQIGHMLETHSPHGSRVWNAYIVATVGQTSSLGTAMKSSRRIRPRPFVHLCSHTCTSFLPSTHRFSIVLMYFHSSVPPLACSSTTLHVGGCLQKSQWIAKGGCRHAAVVETWLREKSRKNSRQVPLFFACLSLQPDN